MIKKPLAEKKPAKRADEHDASSVEMVRNPLLLAVFRLVIQRPRLVCSLWVLVLAACFLVARPYERLKHEPLAFAAFGNRLKDVQQALADDFGLAGQNNTFENVVVWSEQRREIAAAPELKEALAAVEGVLKSVKGKPSAECSREALASMSWQAPNALMPPELARNFVARDKSAAVVLIAHACNLAGIKAQLASHDGKHGGLRVALGSGNAVINSSIDDASEQVASHMLICGPIMWLLLWWNTGSLFRAATAFLCLLCSQFGTRAFTVLLKYLWPAFNFNAPNEVVVVFVQLALCLDYCLFFWTRFSQERARRPEAEHYGDALMTTLQTSGSVIMVSVMVLVVGSLSSTFYPDQNTMGSLAQHLQMIVGINLLGCYSLVVPASLAAMLPALFDAAPKPGGQEEPARCSCGGAARCKLLDKASEQVGRLSGALVTRMSLLVTSRPWIIVLPLLVYACVVPLVMELLKFQPNFDMFTASASQRVPEYEAFHLLEERFSVGQFAPMLVVLEAKHLGPASPLHDDDVAMLQVKMDLQHCAGNCSGEQATAAAALSLSGAGPASAVALSEPFQRMVCRYIRNVVQDTKGREFEIKARDVQSLGWDGEKQGCGSASAAAAAAQGELALMRAAGAGMESASTAALLSKSGERRALRLFPPVSQTSTGAQAMTRFFWKETEPKSRGVFSHNGQRYEFRARHFSDMANIMLLQEQFAERAPFILAALVAAICVIVGVLFSSVGLGLKMICTVVLPIVAEFGLVVGVYQGGWLQWAGLKTGGGLVWMNLYTTVGLLLGLAIDYDIFLFARVYERRLEGYDNVSAVRLAVKETSGVITVAGTVMCVSYFFVALSPIALISQIGVLYLLGVAIDTYLVRTVLAPSMLCLSESMNYWPGKVPEASKSWNGETLALKA